MIAKRLGETAPLPLRLFAKRWREHSGWNPPTISFDLVKQNLFSVIPKPLDDHPFDPIVDSSQTKHPDEAVLPAAAVWMGSLYLKNSNSPTAVGSRKAWTVCRYLLRER